MTDTVVTPTRAPVLVAWASKHGSTREVAEATHAALRDRGVDADLRPATEVQDPSRYAAAVVGGSIYFGRLNRDAVALLERIAGTSVPVAVFALGPQDLAEANVAASRKQLDRALVRIRGLEPVDVAIFGGVVDPAKLRFPFNRFAAGDARDWEAIGSWAISLAERLPIGVPAAP